MAYSLNDRLVAARRLRHQLFPARRRRRPRGRAQRHRHARPLRQRELPERERVRSRPTTGTTACRRIPRRRSSIRRSMPASSTGRGTGGSVTYGDPEIGGRPPRYQNWNAGVQYALTRTITVGATYAGSRGDFLGGSGRGFYANQLDPRFLVLGNLLTQQATPANIAAAQAIVPGVGLPYPNFSGTIAQMLRPFPQYSGRDRRLRRRRAIHVPLAAAHRREAAVRRWADRELQLHVQPDRGQSRGADRLRLRSGLGRRRQRSAARLERDRRLRPAVRRGRPSRAAAIRSSRAIVKDWQVSGITQFRSGRPLGSIGAACNLPNAGTCYADFNPAFSGPVRINGDYGDGDVLGANPPTYIDRNAFQSPRAVHLRQHAADARVRSAQPELLQPGPQRPARLPDRAG